MKNYNLAAAILLGMFSSSAFAGGPAPFYLGGSVGQVEVDNEPGGFDNAGICENAGKVSAECHIGDGGSAGHIYGGFQLNDTYAIEVGYADLGTTASYNYANPAVISQETKTLTAAAVGRYRLGKSSRMLAYGKAGLHAWQTEAKVDPVADHDYRIPTGSTKDEGIDPLIGAGMEYELNHNISIRLGWDRYFGTGDSNVLVDFDDYDKEVGDLNTLDTDVDVYSAGINFSFL